MSTSDFQDTINNLKKESADYRKRLDLFRARLEGFDGKLNSFKAEVLETQQHFVGLTAEASEVSSPMTLVPKETQLKLVA